MERADLNIGDQNEARLHYDSQRKFFLKILIKFKSR